MFGFISFILVGGIAGWVSGELVYGDGFGLLENILIGIVGSIVGGILFSILGLGSGNFLGKILTATVGSVILLFILNQI